MNRHDIVVIGASAGGVEALSALVAGLSPSLAASVLIVQHIAPDSPGYLAEILDRRGPLRAVMPESGQRLEQGLIYVAPPNLHLVVKPGHVHLTAGPHENRSRPSIDVLFRSAAVAYSTRVIGVILTGLQDDGAEGLRAVKRCGGMAVIQDPDTAEFPSMPMRAREVVNPDRVLPLEGMAAVLNDLISLPAPDPLPIPADIEAEARFAEMSPSRSIESPRIGRPTALSCPICDGPLQDVGAEPGKRFRCHLGHSFSADTLELAQSAELERALWSAMRMMEERIRVLRQMAANETERGRLITAAQFEERTAELLDHTAQLRALIEALAHAVSRDAVMAVQEGQESGGG